MDKTYISDWAHLLLRWGHLVFGAAWIGASFYFNWLNNQLRPPREPERGVGGELWAVHGGYFYRVLKYQVAPEKLPATLHWFKWEAYLTWLTGIGLLAVVYYMQADVYMARPGSGLSAATSVHIGMATIAGGFLAYHFLCKTPLVDRRPLFAGLGLAAVAGIAYGLNQVMGARAAYIHVGALLGTCMALNVFFVIIPNQRKMVADMIAGREPDARVGKAGALRSLHNNYMTLPVLWIMVSNHFPGTFGHAQGWAILAAVAVIGGGVRHWFNLHGRGI
ncbi:MAG TPA: urate hydroxylase PuuD, partial [Kofleriaceae bacterium]|nr:urate hydroxylase PuuD [Kofleriaceae bacterium]